MDDEALTSVGHLKTKGGLIATDAVIRATRFAWTRAIRGCRREIGFALTRRPKARNRASGNDEIIIDCRHRLIIDQTARPRQAADDNQRCQGGF